MVWDRDRNEGGRGSGSGSGSGLTGSNFSPYVQLEPPRLRNEQSADGRLTLSKMFSRHFWAENPALVKRICILGVFIVAVLSIIGMLAHKHTTINDRSTGSGPIPNLCLRNASLCLNGGQCGSTSTGRFYVCACKFGFEGLNCESKNECAIKNYCLNNGTCVNGSSGFTCVCTPEFSGPLCDSDVNECQLNRTLCSNRGTCQNLKGSYACRCLPGYEGRNCQLNIDDCQLGSVPKCLNGGTCVDKLRDYECRCPSGTYGINCNETVSCSKVITNTSAVINSLKVIHLGCGGLISIPGFPLRTSFLLNYNSNVTRDELCLWQFENKDNRGSNHRIVVKVSVLCGVQDGSSTLSIFNWKYHTKLDDVILFHSPINTTQGYATNSSDGSDRPDYKLFLSYDSSYPNNNNASGFLVLVQLLSTSNINQGSNLVYTKSPGNGTFGPFRDYDTFSMVLDPVPKQAITTITVHYMESKRNVKNGTCSAGDSLDIYEMSPRNGHNKLARLCGNITSPLNYTSSFPILTTFRTESSRADKGFHLSWQ